jgi:glucan phosphoethanolaminetransferase (alkaline phosphatase superfamily)
MLKSFLSERLIYRLFLIPVLLILSGLFILGYYYMSGVLRWEALPIHFFVSICYFVFLAGLSVLLTNLDGNKPSLIVKTTAAVPVLGSLWYILQHFTTFIGYLFWSDEVSIMQLLVYLPHLVDLLNHLGIPTTIFFLISVTAIFGIALVHIIWFRSLSRCFQRMSIQDAGKPHWKVILSTIASLLPVVIYGIIINNNHLLSLRGEPFADVFRSGRVYDLQFKPTDPNLRTHMDARNNFISDMPYDFEQKHVAIIMLDAARADHMSVYGYERETTPFLDSLSTSGHLTRISFAVSPCPWSECGITSMLSSQFYKRVHQTSYTMQEAFSDLGYQTHFLLSGDHSRLYPFMKRFYGNKLTSFRDGMASDRYPADDQLVIDYIYETLQNSGQNHSYMFYFHLMSTHGLGARYSEFNVFEPHDFRQQAALMQKGKGSNLTDRGRQILINNYDNGMLQADYFIQQIFDQLDTHDMLENTIVIITSDHGEALGESGMYGHAREVHHATISVPLLIFDQSSESLDQDNSPAFGSLIDIPATIFSKLNLPIPKSWEGVRLDNESRRVSHHQSSIQAGNQGVILQYGEEFYFLEYSRKDGKKSVYNLSNDPLQENNIINEIDEYPLQLLKQAYQVEF